VDNAGRPQEGFKTGISLNLSQVIVDLLGSKQSLNGIIIGAGINSAFHMLD
jgi:hypothetical protein